MRFLILICCLMACNWVIAQQLPAWKVSRLPKLLEVTAPRYTRCAKVTQWDLAFESTQPVTALVTAINLSDPSDCLFAVDSVQEGLHHQVWLNGLVPGSRYLIRISLKHEKHTWNWTQDTLETAALPARVKPISVTEGRDIRMHVPGFHDFVAVHDIAGTGAVQVLDAKGRVRWYHDAGVPVGTFCFTRRNTLSMITNPDEILEVDIRGNTVTHINGRVKGQEWRIHHDLYDDTDTSFLAIAFYSRTLTGLDSLGHYLPSEIVYGDGLIRIGKSGKVLWKWDCFDHANPLETPGILKSLSDWNHANSIFTDTDGNILISYKHLDQVWKISPGTGAILWKVGKGGTIPMQDSVPFLRQHTISRFSDGRYYVFDNGREPERPVSRISWFEISGASPKLSGFGTIPLPEALFSSRKGSVFPIGNGFYLACSSDAMQVLLVNESGSIPVRWNLGFIPLRANIVPGAFLPQVQE